MKGGNGLTPPGVESPFQVGTLGYGGGEIGNQTAIEFMGITRLNESTLPYEYKRDSSNGYSQTYHLNPDTKQFVPNLTSSLNTTLQMGSAMG